MSKRTRNLVFWAAWVLGSSVLGSWLAYALVGPGDMSVFMPGPLSDGHHQLAGSCESCHADRFGGGEVLQASCMRCHGDIRKKPMDSHPRTKFTDPRNADRLQAIDALACTSCHTEHRPQITLANGLTQPRDVCFHCHAKVGEERASHQGMAFTTCTDAGCHNFHDNRALYTDFLIKHLDDLDTKPGARVPERQFAAVIEETIGYPLERFPLQPLGADAIDAPEPAAVPDPLRRDWLETAHAKAGVNCSGCHQPLDEAGTPGAWTDHPGLAGCSGCHDVEVNAFQQGKHGMRLEAGLSPMTPAQARLPMHKTAAHQQLTCTTCHGAHRTMMPPRGGNEARACESFARLLRRPLDVPGCVAGTPKIAYVAPDYARDFVHPRALPGTPRERLATAGERFTGSKRRTGACRR